MRYLIHATTLCAALGLASCESATGSQPDLAMSAEDHDLGSATMDLGTPPDLDVASDLSANTDLAEQKLVACLDRPDEALRPPTGTLPCDLIPPTF